MEKENLSKKPKKRIIKGTVVSDKMDKTVVVQIIRFKFHKKYNKRYQTSVKYKAHDPKNAFHPGDKVEIEEMRPLSKEKRWRVIKKIN